MPGPRQHEAQAQTVAIDPLWVNVLRKCKRPTLVHPPEWLAWGRFSYDTASNPLHPSSGACRSPALRSPPLIITKACGSHPLELPITRGWLPLVYPSQEVQTTVETSVATEPPTA